eukprot:gene25667-biopygen7507
MECRTEELDNTGRAIGRVRFPCKSDASDSLVIRMRPIYKEFGRVKNAIKKNAFSDAFLTRPKEAFLTRPNVSVEFECRVVSGFSHLDGRSAATSIKILLSLAGRF